MAGKPKLLRPVHASVGLECEYCRRLQCLVDDMNASVQYWLTASYRANAPELHEEDLQKHTLAQDAVPANELKRSVRKLSRQWQRKFNEAAQELARWFTRANRNRSVTQLQSILKKGGWSVEFKMTPAQRDVFQATVHENVNLIKSIPQQYFTQVEGMVMRSVQTGRDLQQLTDDLQDHFHVTRKRAKLIAGDQNNKVTANFHRVHQIELGITEAVWVHSHAGKVPRPTHLCNDGQRYDVRRGWFDPDPKVRKYIMPGELINCRCFSRSVIPGFS